ncbi:hypothetical protein OIDMADRAFT_179508 [Oidiodendron maius Zn]|uniref:Uncharacterized protein n=1 Tax=Oidiodendron maius (strain Zn) TaxID=913774 RepID=A0A0C3HGJ8_OIDMZ|nr:hypothetical protein OIDMADRAFT_179508 [Oidiodendron maius Zn]
MAYEVQKESDMEYLKYYETEAYKVKGWKIKLARPVVDDIGQLQLPKRNHQKATFGVLAARLSPCILVQRSACGTLFGGHGHDHTALGMSEWTSE